MLKLVLRLFGLFSSLLFLYHSKGINWLDILPVTLCPLVLHLVLLLLLVVDGVFYRGHSVISNCLLPRFALVDSTNAQRFVVIVVECFLLVVIIQNVHRKALIWQSISVIPTILWHLVDFYYLILWLCGLLSIKPLSWRF